MLCVCVSVIVSVIAFAVALVVVRVRERIAVVVAHPTQTEGKAEQKVRWQATLRRQARTERVIDREQVEREPAQTERTERTEKKAKTKMGQRVSVRVRARARVCARVRPASLAFVIARWFEALLVVVIVAGSWLLSFAFVQPIVRADALGSQDH